MRDKPPAATYDVVWPLAAKGPMAVVNNSREAALAGARVGFIWDYLFCGEEIFAEVKTQLGQQFPHVTFVDHATFGNFHAQDEEEKLAGLPEMLRINGVTAVVVAVGG